MVTLSIRSMWGWLLIAGGALVCQRSASAQDRPIVALFEMEDRESGIKPEVLSNLTELLAIYLAEGGYQVIPRDQVRARLREQKQESQKPCYDQSCQVDLGRELAAQKTVSTQIIKMGGTCHLTAALMDLKRAATEKAASAKAACNEKDLGAAVEEIAKKLTAGIQSTPAVSKSEQQTQDALKLQEERTRIEAARKADEERKRQAALAAKARADEERRRQEEARHQAEMQARLEPPREIAPPRTSSDDGKPEVTATSASEKQGLSMNTWGHIAFWTGTGVTALAVPAFLVAKSAADDYSSNPTKDSKDKSRTWMGVVWGSIGVGTALMTTGIALWLMGPESAKGSAVSLLPIMDGKNWACALQGRW